MKILLTGHKGYIGSHILPKLLRFEDDRVEVCDTKNGPWDDYATISGQVYDVVVHMGALSTILGSVEQADFLLDNNAFKITRFLRNNEVGKFIFPSTGGAIYGERTIPAKEDEANWNSCLNPYSQSKYIAEKIIRELSPNHTILRLGNVFGRDMECRTESLALTCFKHDTPIRVFGGDQTRDFVHIDVVCNAVLNAIDMNVIGTFNIANGESISIRMLAEKFAKQRNVPVVYEPANSIEVVNVALDVTAARNAGLIPKNPPANDYNS